MRIGVGSWRENPMAELSQPPNGDRIISGVFRRKFQSSKLKMRNRPSHVGHRFGNGRSQQVELDGASKTR